MVREFCFRRAALVVFTLLLVVSGASVSEAAGVGDFCWTVKITQTEQGPVTMPGFLGKFHIRDLDPATFAMTGIITVPGDNPFILTGTATQIGTKVYANLVGTQDHKVEPSGHWRDMDIVRATFDSVTLKGTIFSVGQSFNMTTHEFGPMYASGTLTPRACP